MWILNLKKILISPLVKQLETYVLFSALSYTVTLHLTCLFCNQACDLEMAMQLAVTFESLTNSIPTSFVDISFSGFGSSLYRSQVTLFRGSADCFWPLEFKTVSTLACQLLQHVICKYKQRKININKFMKHVLDSGIVDSYPPLVPRSLISKKAKAKVKR